MSLDLGELLGSVDLIITPFERKYSQVVGMMSRLGGEATKAGGQTVPLERGLAAIGAAGDAAATGLGRADKALVEAGLSASQATVVTKAYEASTSQAALASSKLTQAELRRQAATQRVIDVETTAAATTRRLAAAEAELEALQAKEGVSADKVAAAQERVNALRAQSVATTGRLAGAQATLVAANDRVAISQEKVASSTMFGARTADSLAGAWAKIPGPVKVAAAALSIAAVETLKAATNYQMLVRNLQTGANESAANLHMVGDGMLHMAGQVGFSADTLARSMFYVESAGYHGAAGLNVLKTAAEGAKVDFVDLPTMVDALTSAMDAYHEPVSRAAHVTNTLIASAAVGKMHLQDLAAALGTVLPSAAALNVPLAQVGAAMATMTMQGTNAQRAATYLRFAFAALANPTQKAQDAMALVGLTSEKVANTMTHGGLPAVFTLLEQHVGQKFPLGSAKYLAALANMVGGTRGLQAVLELTGKNLGTMQANLDSIDGRVKGAGNSVSDWADVQKNLNLQWSEFIDGLGAAGIKIGEDLLPAATQILHVLNSLGHDVGDVIGFFEHNRVAAIALAAVLTGMLAPAVVRTAVALGTLALEKIYGLFYTLAVAIRAATVAFVEADGAVVGFGAALESLNLNPVMLSIIAVTAAGAALWHVLGDGAKANYNKGVQAADDYVRSLNIVHDSLARNTADVQLLAQHTEAAFKGIGGGNIDEEVGKLNEYAKQLGVAAQANQNMRRNEASLEQQFHLSQAQIERLAQANGIDLAGSYQQVATAIQAAMGPTAQITNDTRSLGKSAQGSANEVNALSDALSRLAGDALSADQAEIAFKDDIANLKTAIDKANGSLDLHSTKGREARNAMDSAALQAIQWANAEAKLKGGTDKARAALESSISSIKAVGGHSAYTQHVVNELQDALDKISPAAHKAGAGMQAGGAQMAAAAQRDVARVLAALKHGTAGIENAGVDFSSGFAAGITAGQAKAIHAAAVMGALSYQAAKNAIQSKSPSRLLRLLGQDGFASGFALGIEDGTPRVVAAATRMAAAAYAAAKASVFKTIAAGVAPTPTDPTVLAGTLAIDTTRAISLQQRANELKVSATAAEQAATAAKHHAQQLSNEAHAAATAAANMNGATKADAAAKRAAEAHSRALATEARAASQAATKASAAASKASSAWSKASQAAQTAAQSAADAANALVTNLASAADQMASTIQSFLGQISGDITGDSSLSSIWQSLTGTDANGNPITPTLGGVQSTLDGILSSAQQFSNDLNQILAEGGNQDLITQLADMGTTAGDALAQQLLAAGPSAIQALETVMGSITSVAGTEAQTLANAFYGPGENAMIQFIDGLEKKFPELKKALQQIVNEIEASLGAVGITTGIGGGSTSTGSSGSTTTGGGKMPKYRVHGWGLYPVGFPHFAGGVRNFGGGFAVVGELGPEIVRLPRGSSVYPHGSDGASMLDMSAVVDRLDRIEARLADAPALTGREVGVATLTGYREAGQAHARQLTRDARKR